MTDAVSSRTARTSVPWWLVLLQACFAVFIGLLLVGAGDIETAQGTMLVVRILGWYWFFVGILDIVFIFVDHTMWGWKLFSGGLGIIAGLYIIEHPIWATLVVPATFVIVLGIIGIAMGISDIVKAFTGGGWGIGALGALSIVLGLWLLSNRLTATLVFPWVAGILAIAFGIAGIFAAFRARSA